MGIQNFEVSRIWNSSIELAVTVYELVKKLPNDEKFALSSQVRRAVVSVSINIAEGFGRTDSKEKLQFYNIAYGSLLETKSLLMLSVKLGFFVNEDILKPIDGIALLQRQINATRKAVKERAT
jgi:four helix bundle protein